MTVEVEHIQYEFDMLCVCVVNILKQENAGALNLVIGGGFLSAWNLWNYCKDNDLLDKMYRPSDCRNKGYLEEIVQTIHDQIVTLTQARTSKLEEKLAPQDMQDMFKFFYHNGKLLGINPNKLSNYQQYVDRYLVYGDRIRVRK